MSLNAIALAVMAMAGFLLLCAGVVSALRHEKGRTLANCLLIVAGAALLAVVAAANSRARADTPANPAVVYNPKKYPSHPYPTPELFRKEGGRLPKSQNI